MLKELFLGSTDFTGWGHFQNTPNIKTFSAVLSVQQYRPTCELRYIVKVEEKQLGGGGGGGRILPRIVPLFSQDVFTT